MTKAFAENIETTQSMASLQALRRHLNQKVIGKPEVIDFALTTMLARGHLLLEDVPGVGKTTLARHLAASVDGEFQRIQFTSDLLPMDVIGVQVYRRSTETFEFNHGPIFANFVVADEINRAAPKTQSSLLQAMNELEVSIDRKTFPLKKPFMVIATQNPLNFEGTFPLPENQLDRFMMSIRIGYPDRVSERQILERAQLNETARVQSVIGINDLIELQNEAGKVHCDESVIDYLQDLVDATRESRDLALGVSPRGAMTLLSAARAHALVSGRSFVTPNDIKTLTVPCLAHRIRARNAKSTNQENELILKAILQSLVVPV